MKSLIIYYSYEGNSEKISDAIQAVTGADVVRICPKKEKKSKSLFRFIWGGIQTYIVKTPEIKPISIDFNQYDVIFIGTPVWFGTFAPPLKTFFREYKLIGKKVGLFCCSRHRKKSTFDDLKRMLKGNDFIGEIEFVLPIKMDLETAQDRAQRWANECLLKP